MTWLINVFYLHQQNAFDSIPFRIWNWYTTIWQSINRRRIQFAASLPRTHTPSVEQTEMKQINLFVQQDVCVYDQTIQIVRCRKSLNGNGISRVSTAPIRFAPSISIRSTVSWFSFTFFYWQSNGFFSPLSVIKSFRRLQSLLSMPNNRNGREIWCWFYDQRVFRLYLFAIIINFQLIKIDFFCLRCCCCCGGGGM